MRRSIRNLRPEFKQLRSIRTGNGSKTVFWLDEWIVRGPLKDQFPNSYDVCRFLMQMWLNLELIGLG